MSDLVRRIKNEFASWYTPRENRVITESLADSATFYVGLLEIPHPTLKIRLTLNQHLQNKNLADLIDKPLSDLAEDDFLGSFIGVDDSSVDSLLFYINRRKADDSGKSYQFWIGDVIAYKSLEDANAVIEFVNGLQQCPLSNFIEHYEPDEEGITITRTENGIIYSVSADELAGESPYKATIDGAFLDKIARAENMTEVNKIFSNLAGKNIDGSEAIETLVQIATLTNLYAKREIAFDVAGRAHGATRETAQLRAIADSLDLASFVTFSDCQYNSWKSLPQATFTVFDTRFKLPEELTSDERFLESVAQYAKQRGAIQDFLEQRFMQTPNTKLKSSTRTYFAKQIILSRVQSADYELEAARRLQELGFDVPEPVGLAIIRRAPLHSF